MAISYIKRFDGQTPDIIKSAYRVGIPATMRIYAPHGDYFCFKKFLVDASKDQNIGSHPQVSSSNPERMAEQIVEQFLIKYRELKTTNELLREQLRVERLARETRDQNLSLGVVELFREVG